MTDDTPRLCFSYLRFSRAEQAKGSSTSARKSPRSLLLDVELAARLRERAVDAGGAAVDDDEVGAIAGEEAVQHLLTQLGCVPVPVPRLDDVNGPIIPLR